jgi:nicotinic acid mononucleotide adenylyltransferase
MADEIFQRATIAYSDRIGSGAPDIEKRYRDDFGARIILCDLPYIELSSSELREKARNGVLTSEYTPQKVVDYIVNHSLYK